MSRGKRGISEQAVIEAFARLKRVQPTADEFGITYHHVYGILRRHGIEVRYLSVFDEHKEAIIAEYLTEKTSVVDIAKRYGVSDGAIDAATFAAGAATSSTTSDRRRRAPASLIQKRGKNRF